MNKSNFLTGKKEIVAVFLLLCVALTSFAQRDPYKWPFDKYSIWNMPIHRDAVYVPACITAPLEAGLLVDEDYLILTPNAPETAIYTNYNGWTQFQSRCDSMGPLLSTLPIPSDFVISYDNWISSTPNAGVAILRADGQTLFQTQPFSRCEAGKYATSEYVWPDQSIFGAGIAGAHGGSGMSCIGGTIRVGEWLPGGSIRHAFKVNIDASRFLDYKESNDGKRWPAPVSDGYAHKYYGTKGNPEPECLMGALLALRGDLNLTDLNFETGNDGPAMILAKAFQDYGAYIVDDPYQDVVAIETEFSPEGRVIEEFEKSWGYPLECAAETPFGRDMAKIIIRLNVVANNAENTIGGGPTSDLVNRRAPTACDFGVPGSGLMCPAAIPAISPATAVTVNHKQLSLNIGENYQLLADVHPRAASNHAVTWISENPAVAVIDQQGNVKALAEGKAKIRLSSVSNPVFDNCMLTVLAKPIQDKKKKKAEQPKKAEAKCKHKIGDFYGGGIIFSVWKDSNKVERALVLSVDDLSTDRMMFGEFGTCKANSLDNGKENTSILLKCMGDKRETAATLCANYRAGGFTDWYLPSIKELVKVVPVFDLLNEKLKNDNNPQTIEIPKQTYWSSSEVNKQDVWMCTFLNGFHGYYRKDLKYRVRAVREVKF